MHNNRSSFELLESDVDSLKTFNSQSVSFEKRYRFASPSFIRENVRLCVNVKTHEKFAVAKILMKPDSEKQRQYLITEIKCLKILEHKNVIKMVDIFDEPEVVYILMEHADGGHLLEKFYLKGSNSKRYNEHIIRKIIKIVIEALQYCLSKKVIHRDVKPENVLLKMIKNAKHQANPSGRVIDLRRYTLKLADFGLSKLVDTDRNVSTILMQTYHGTWLYQAPEIFNRKEHTYKCDVWSVGIMTYQFLSGGEYFPYNINRQELGNCRQIYENCIKTTKDDWAFKPDANWNDISDLAKNFLTRVLVKDPKGRPSYEQLLADPWMTGKLPGKHLIKTATSQNVLKTKELQPKNSLQDDSHESIFDSKEIDNIQAAVEITKAFTSSAQDRMDDFDEDNL